jgi:hypothetical protein
MAPLNGADLLINVETATPDTFVEVKDGRAWSGTLTSQSTTVAVFNRATKYTAASSTEEVYTLGWLLNLDDAGQIRVRAQARAQAATIFQFLYDGTNGFEQEMIITERGASADPDGNLMEFTATLSANDVPVVVGTGSMLL